MSILLLALLTASPPSEVLASFPQADPARQLVLVAGPCKRKVRTLSVELRSPSGTIGSPLPLEWSASCALRSSGVEEGARVWTVQGENAVAEGVVLQLRALPVRFSSDARGVALTASIGVELTHPSHRILVVTESGVRLVWAGEQTLGPLFSFVKLMPEGDRDALVYVQTEWNEIVSPRNPDRWDAHELHYSSSADGLDARPVPAWFTILATTDTVEAARQTQRAIPRECGGVRLYVVETDDFPRLAPKKFVLASISPQKAEAVSEKKRFDACWPKLGAYVKQGS